MRLRRTAFRRCWVDLSEELISKLRYVAKESNIRDASALKATFIDLIVSELEKFRAWKAYRG